ncbi:hypothetical protein MJO10_29545, partial [Salmonella enterica subsp. enterica serovar Anatum]|nr:hypothetical protein [Salmonella enterica subsp. enterica serovar Anatum]
YPRARHFDVARIVIDQAVRLGVAQADFTGLPAKWQPINDYGAIWWLCLMHIASGIAQCVTIIGIPVGIANFKIAAIALWPVGRRV